MALILLFTCCIVALCILYPWQKPSSAGCSRTIGYERVKADIFTRRIEFEKVNNEYYGSIELKYMLKPNCLYYCNMIVIGEQQSAANVTMYMNYYFKVGTTLNNVFCNARGCKYHEYSCVQSVMKEPTHRDF